VYIVDTYSIRNKDDYVKKLVLLLHETPNDFAERETPKKDTIPNIYLCDVILDDPKKTEMFAF